MYALDQSYDEDPSAETIVHYLYSIESETTSDGDGHVPHASPSTTPRVVPEHHHASHYEIGLSSAHLAMFDAQKRDRRKTWRNLRVSLPTHSVTRYVDVPMSGMPATDETVSQPVFHTEKHVLRT